MDSVPVTLIVKASNQQFEDLTVTCEPCWSVKQLKEYLSQSCPHKPKVEEQKIIYAGQLLKDNLLLKDILRKYEDVQLQKHIIHLVCKTKMRQTPNSSKCSKKENADTVTMRDGLRQRNVQIATNSEASNNIPQFTAGSANVCPNSVPVAGINVPYNFQNPPNEYLMAQQLAMYNWMQQAYLQYMNQYMNLLQTGVRPETVFMQNQSNPPTLHANNMAGIPQIPFLQGNFPSFNTQNFPNASISSSAAVVNSNVVGASTHSVPAQSVPEQPHPQPNEQPQPRFPNIVQEELPENRDWLDMFYLFSRILLLLTLVYFYSSPLRCLIVIFIGLAIYLYHIGFFRTTAEANNNNNNAAAVAGGGGGRGDETNQRQEAQQQQLPPNAPQLNNNNNTNNNVNDAQRENRQPISEENSVATVERGETSSSSVPEAQNNGTSVIAFIRTFVVSFFVSLLPEPPAL